MGVMKLDEYLKTTTQVDLASRLGVTQSLVNQWLKGSARITAERAVQIEAATSGMVTRNELRPDVFGDLPAKAAA